MVDKEVVLSTIKKMLDAGLDDQVITTTLSDVGLTQSEIKSYLAQAKQPALKIASQEPADSSQETALTQDDLQVSSSVQNPLAEENALLHETTHMSLEEHSESFNEVLERLTKLEAMLLPISKLPVLELNQKIVSLDKKMSDSLREISEVKAQASALLEILEKVLETDRDTLLELQKKK